MFRGDAEPHIAGYEGAIYSVFETLEEAAVYVMVSDDGNADCDIDDVQDVQDVQAEKPNTPWSKRPIDASTSTETNPDEPATYPSKKLKTGISMISFYPRNIRYTPITPPAVTNVAASQAPLMVPSPNQLSSQLSVLATTITNNSSETARNFQRKKTSVYVPIAPHPPSHSTCTDRNVYTDTKHTSTHNTNSNDNATPVHTFFGTSVNNKVHLVPTGEAHQPLEEFVFENIGKKTNSILKGTFTKHLRKISKYKKEHGNLYIDNTKIMDEELKILKECCEFLCQQFESNSLSKSQISALHSNKFYPETWKAEMLRMNSDPTPEWLIKYNLVKDYKQSKGYFVVAETNPRESEMIQWLRQQCVAIKKNEIPYSQKKLLQEELDFDHVKWLATMKTPLEDEFMDMYQKFINHIKSTGSCLVFPIDDEKDELMEWVRKTCHNMKRKYMSDRKKILMASISGFDPDDWCRDMKNLPSNDWINKCYRAQSYKDKYGDLCIPMDHEEYEELVPWLKCLCERLKYNKIGNAKLKLLEKLDFSPDEWRAKLSKQEEFQRWETKYQELRIFHNQNGHVDLPKGHRLIPWIRDQKHEYKLLMETKESKMTLSKMQKLIEIGFVFQKLKPRPPTWQERLQQLKQFKERYGHCDVRKDEKTGLGTWVINQRYKYNQFKKGERKTNIPEELLRELADIGFNFQLGKTPGNWDDWYQELVEYKAIVSHISFPFLG